MKQYLNGLEDAMKTYWDSLAVCNFRGEEFTYGQLATNIEKFGIFFEKAGVKKGDKIAIFAKNSARWATSFFSISAYGAVVVPLLGDFLPENAQTLVDHSGSVMLFVDAENWPKMDPEKMPNVRCVIDNSNYSILYCREDSVSAAFNSINDDFNAKYPMGFSAANVQYTVENPDDLAVINYTSGTTSAPKGVMLTYNNISSSVDFAVRKIPASNSDNIVSMLPMGHIYGMVFEFIYPITCGVTIYYLGKAPAASTLIKALGEVKPYLIITVPLVMEKIAKSSIKPVLDKPAMKVLTSIPGIKNILFGVIRKKLMTTFGGNVKQIIMGGAALNPDIEKIFRKLGLPYTVGYGMTEASPLLAYAHPKYYVQGSCGEKVDSCTVRIDSEDPEHIAGEIQAKGPNITIGYYNNPEASANAFTEDGFLRTGDLGVMDSKGNITIRGRSKNMILSANGQNIYPEEVEAVVNAQPFVGESVVVDRSSKLVALVYLDQEGMKKAGLDAEAIADVPEQVRVVSNKSLPAYSQITKVEVVLAPFEKTPKMSIKRFLYK